MSPTILDILNESERRLTAVDSPRLSAEVLVAHVLGCSRLSLVLDRGRNLSDSEVESIHELVARREMGEPIAYILGEKEFYGLNFRVSPDVLIPRPETEHIIEEVEALFSKSARFRFADLGTGSGILAVTISVLFHHAQGLAVDLSPAALDVARANASFHGVDDRIEFRLADITDTWSGEDAFDLIVSNPPYVTQAEFEVASHEVTAFEPTMALVSGEDGLDHVRKMLPGVIEALTSGGYLFMEIGCGQGEGVKKIMLDHYPQFEQVKVLQDLSGLDRIVTARKL